MIHLLWLLNCFHKFSTSKEVPWCSTTKDLSFKIVLKVNNFMIICNNVINHVINKNNIIKVDYKFIVSDFLYVSTVTLICPCVKKLILKTGDILN